MIVEAVGIFVKFLDERVDIGLAPRAVEAAFVERTIKTLAKDIRLTLDPMNDLLDLSVAHSIRQRSHFDRLRKSRAQTSPTPRNVKSNRQLIQIGAQPGPVALRARRQRVTDHKAVNPRRPTQH